MFENFLLDPIQDDAELLPIISIEGDEDEEVDDEYPDVLPVLALKNTVLFPGVVIPINIGRKKSVKAIQQAFDAHKMIAVLSQHDMNVEDPSVNDLYTVGTVAKIVKVLKMPDGSKTAILQGRKRFSLLEMLTEDPIMMAKIELRQYGQAYEDLEFKATLASIKDQAKKIVELSPHIPSEALIMIKNISSDMFLINFIASNLGIKIEQKQELLDQDDLKKLSSQILIHMNDELQMLELRDKIENKVRGDIEKQQRDYFLNQQLKTIQEELGQNPQQEELASMVEKAKTKNWPESVQKVFDKEINKAQRTNPQVAEYSVLLNYLETLLDLPWEDYTEDNFDLSKVKKILDEDHFGLEKVKDRILEHLAVLKLKGDMKAPIVCLVGPPGVGKTSLGKSVSRALGRNFVRISLGGLHDESEIRGHRKTYIGAMPGRIVQSIKKAKSSNPVFILDEIDKIGKDFRGDPSSALLEVLDPEQNSTFYDNYLELEYDLSKVLFIATANSLSTIQPALIDRMEIIEISGYSMEEKLEIARRHLIPKQRVEHGLKARQIRLKDEVIKNIIQAYTRESGVRSLDRQIAGVMRATAKKVAMEENYPITLPQNELRTILGPKKYTNDLYSEPQVPGVAIGLAWTRVGGDILFIETSLSKGSGKLSLTGNLGDVMKESATTALSFLKSHAKKLGINAEAFMDKDVHVHIPEGAIPKDGPSAGITMLLSLASAFSKMKIKPFVAMSGEITLRGKLLPVGGIKEKVLAAKRAGLKEIILSEENQMHVEEIEPSYIENMEFKYFDRMQDVVQYALY